jgi:hypothetical protein
MERLCRDPWVPWTVFSPLCPSGPDRYVTADVTSVPAPADSTRPVYRAALWVHADDGAVRCVPLAAER